MKEFDEMDKIVKVMDTAIEKITKTSSKARDIIVSLSPPITEHCSKCDYEAFYSFGSFHVDCPECGESSIRHGARHQLKPVFCTANQGSYDWAHPSDKQWNYTFHNLPDGHQSFTVDDELDYSDPLNLAYELKEIIDRYLLNSAKPKIAALYKWLEENEEDQNVLRVKKKKQDLETELYKLIHQNKYTLGLD
jgi:hypothetical protein